MCHLLETIRLENGVFQHLSYHQARMRIACEAFFSGKSISLDATLTKSAPEKGLFKCRIVYDTQIREVKYIPYHIPMIRSLRMVNDNQIDYSHKFLDRNSINVLFQQRGKADDVLIIKNGLITDISFCNVLFYKDKQWFTPTKPLLAGTQRQHLIDHKIIKIADIRPEDIPNFSQIRLINAMIRFEDELDIAPSSVF